MNSPRGFRRHLNILYLHMKKDSKQALVNEGSKHIWLSVLSKLVFFSSFSSFFGTCVSRRATSNVFYSFWLCMSSNTYHTLLLRAALFEDLFLCHIFTYRVTTCISVVFTTMLNTEHHCKSDGLAVSVTLQLLLGWVGCVCRFYIFFHLVSSAFKHLSSHL